MPRAKDDARVTHCLKAYPKLINLLNQIGETDEISLDLTHEQQLDLHRCSALKLLKELGELK